MKRIACALCSAALGMAWGTAAADPLPVVEHAGDANLEPVGPHSGLTLTVALLGTSIIALDSSGDVGRGPGASLRLGMAATPDTVLTVELTGGSMLHQRMSTLYTNDEVDMLVGAQYYAKPSLWLRAAVGGGRYARRGLFDAGGAQLPDSTHYGPAGEVGAGLDAVRRGKFVLGIELFVAAVVDSSGIVTSSGVGLDLGYQ